MWLHVLATLSVFYLSRKIIAFQAAARRVGNIPGYRTIINRESLLSFFLPRVPGLSLGPNWLFVDKHSVFSDIGFDIMTLVGSFPPKSDVIIADAVAIKEVTTHRGRFQKPVDMYTPLSFFGFNIVVSEGEDWKKYRRTCAPAFSERNNKLVWDETVALINDLFDNVWGKKEVVTIDHCLDLTLPLALFVISTAGFGHKLSWTSSAIIPQGHKMTFKDSLYTGTKFLFHRLIFPDWVLGLSQKTRNVALGFAELKLYMLEMVEDCMQSENLEKDDLFSNLVRASNEESDGLTMDELIGNIYIFLLAGHETTAHSVCFALALLALYPDEQEILCQQVKTVLPNPCAPTYDQMPLLTRTMAVFNETLRMFPPAVIIAKQSTEDTTLRTTNTEGKTVVVPIPKGTYTYIHVPGLHYNPKYWENPHEFKPDRFLGDWNKDAFISFSAGPRACLGRRFAEMEAVVCLTMLVSRYKITVKKEPQFAQETFEERKARVLKTIPGISLTPTRVPLTFTRR